MSHSIRTYHLQLSINSDFRARIAQSIWKSCGVSPILTQVKSDSKVISTLAIKHSHTLSSWLRSSALSLAIASFFCIWTGRFHISYEVSFLEYSKNIGIALYDFNLCWVILLSLNMCIEAAYLGKKDNMDSYISSLKIKFE